MTEARRVWKAMRTLLHERYDHRGRVVVELGMSFIKIRALRRLAAGPLTMRELTERLMTDKPYTTLVVDDLEARGLVVRSAHPDDRRSKIVTLTAAGAAAAARAEAIMDEPPPALVELPPEDLAALERILTALEAGGEATRSP